MALFLLDYWMKRNEMSISKFQNENKTTIFCKIFSFCFNLIYCAFQNLIFLCGFIIFKMLQWFSVLLKPLMKYDNYIHCILTYRWEHHLKNTIWSLLKSGNLFKVFMKHLLRFSHFSHVFSVLLLLEFRDKITKTIENFRKLLNWFYWMNHEWGRLVTFFLEYAITKFPTKVQIKENFYHWKWVRILSFLSFVSQCYFKINCWFFLIEICCPLNRFNLCFFLRHK